MADGGVLVAVVGAPSIADLERALVRCGDIGPVTLLSVVSTLPRAQADLSVPRVDLALKDLLVRARTEWLEGCAAALERRVEHRVRYGGEVKTIVETAVAEGSSMVAVVGDTRPRTRLTVARLIELCPGPVMIEPPGLRGIEPNVLAAIDPDSGLGLNELIVAEAVDRARALGGRLHLVHAWDLAGADELLRSPRVDLTGQDVARFADTVRESHRHAFEPVIAATRALLGDGASGTLQTHLVEGTVADAVARISGLERIGLVVIGTQGRVAVERALGGSDARQVAEADDHATLVVKPPDFVSPLVGG